MAKDNISEFTVRNILLQWLSASAIPLLMKRLKETRMTGFTVKDVADGFI